MGINKAMRNSAIRILVVEDHPIVRERLAEVIHREPDLVVCGEAEDHHQAVDLVDTTHPDLAIIDLTLKQSHGLDLIKDLRVGHPALPVLVFSMHDEALHAEQAVRAGARGYISKQEATSRLIKAIRTVLDGQIYLGPKLTAHLASRLTDRPRSAVGCSVDLLTSRELLVFELLGQGLGTRQIGQRLHLHMSTVETYRARIKDKLGLRDANDLLQHAIRWVQHGGRL